MQTSYVTESILKTSSLPRSCLSLAFGARASGHVRFRVLAPSSSFPVCPRGLPICSKISFALTVERNRTIQRTFTERQKEWNECQASRKSRWKNQGTKQRDQKRKNTICEEEKEEKGKVEDEATLVSVATKTNDDCDKHFGASARPSNPDGTIPARAISFSEGATETCSL